MSNMRASLCVLPSISKHTHGYGLHTRTHLHPRTPTERRQNEVVAGRCSPSGTAIVASPWVNPSVGRRCDVDASVAWARVVSDCG